jgi:hypothetical protein
VDRLTILCYTASSVVHAWEIVYDLSAVSSSYELHLFAATVGAQCGTSWCGILQSNVHFCVTPKCNTDLLESVGENFDLNSVMKEFPASK